MQHHIGSFTILPAPITEHWHLFCTFATISRVAQRAALLRTSVLPSVLRSVMIGRQLQVQLCTDLSHPVSSALAGLVYSAARRLFAGTPSGVERCNLPCQSGSLTAQATRTGSHVLWRRGSHYSGLACTRPW